MTRYRVAIIGCGGIARAHMGAYKEVPQTEVVAGADLSEEALKKFGEEVGITALYQDYRQMMKEVNPDIVSICTYPVHRREITVNVARYPSVKAIYCEKPMCMNLAEAEDMVNTCKERGVVLIVGHQRRYEGRYMAAKGAVKAGAIGQLIRIEAGCPGWDIFEWGTHWLDMFRYYVDDVPARWVLAQIDRRRDWIAYGHRLETECIAQIGFENGVRAVLECGDHITGTFYNRLIGTDGLIEVNAPDRPALQIFNREGYHTPEVDSENPFKRTVQALIETIETGSHHELNGESALQGFELIMAIYESARTGKMVELPLQNRENPFGQMLERVGIPLIVE